MGEKVGFRPRSVCVGVCVRLVGARECCDNALSHRSPTVSHGLVVPAASCQAEKATGDLISAASGFSCRVRCTFS